ncbi:conjugative transposon protein TraM [uncultured Croceitalea sp.]|uniref:conjugative transposon protein TraM n=1 Tax=uncultured Croceitalea sp. TaxID=1798908 RepID=UPI003305A3E6
MNKTQNELVMKMDKKKVVFVSVIGLVVVFIIGYSILVLGDDEKTDELQQTQVPELVETEELYSSKKVAVDAIKEEKERIAPSIYDERLLDETGVYDDGLLDKKKQRMIDSIYRLGRIKYASDSLPNRAKPISKARKKRKKTSKIEEIPNLLEMSLEHQLFFAVSPKLSAEETGESLKVEIDGEQTVKANDRLQMRVTSQAVLQEIKIKKNTVLYGIVKFKPNRVVLVVSSIEGNPVELIAYDIADGLEGIFIKNSFRGDAVNQVLGDAVQDINIPGVPQVSGIKRVFQRNNRNVKVTINNNYRLILKPKQ